MEVLSPASERSESPRGFAVPPPIPDSKNRRHPEEEPVINTDKVNALLTSASALEWNVRVTLQHPPAPLPSGGVPPVNPPLMTLSSRVPAKQARLVMTELRTRMPSGGGGSGQSPTLSQVLISGMRELGAVELEDIVIGGGSSSKKKRGGEGEGEGEGEGGEAVGGGWEGLIEVVCVTEFKRLVTYRARGDLDEGVAHALAGGLRRLRNLQKAAHGPHDPAAGSIAAVVVSGLMCWDRDEDD